MLKKWIYNKVREIVMEKTDADDINTLTKQIDDKFDIPGVPDAQERVRFHAIVEATVHMTRDWFLDRVRVMLKIKKK